MPTYEYQCEKCGFEFEREQRSTEEPIKTCPECKSRKAKRLLSAPNFILKGGGWYKDGYGSSGKKSSGSGGKDSSGDDSSSKSDSASKSDASSPSPPSTGTSESKSKDTKKTGGTKSSKSASG